MVRTGKAFCTVITCEERHIRIHAAQYQRQQEPTWSQWRIYLRDSGIIHRPKGKSPGACNACMQVCVQAIPVVNYASMLTRRHIAALGTETFLSFQSAKEGIRLLRYHEIWYDPKLCWGSWISQVWGCKGRAQGHSREVRQYRVPTKLHTKIFAHQLCCQPPTKPGVFQVAGDGPAALRWCCGASVVLWSMLHRGHPATNFTSFTTSYESTCSGIEDILLPSSPPSFFASTFLDTVP